MSCCHFSTPSFDWRRGRALYVYEEEEEEEEEGEEEGL
jgi:hypothetical protein